MVDLASDFLDRKTPVFRDDVCFFISQSGEYYSNLFRCVSLASLVSISLLRCISLAKTLFSLMYWPKLLGFSIRHDLLSGTRSSCVVELIIVTNKIKPST